MYLNSIRKCNLPFRVLANIYFFFQERPKVTCLSIKIPVARELRGLGVTSETIRRDAGKFHILCYAECPGCDSAKRRVKSVELLGFRSFEGFGHSRDTRDDKAIVWTIVWTRSKTRLLLKTKNPESRDRGAYNGRVGLASPPGGSSATTTENHVAKLPLYTMILVAIAVGDCPLHCHVCAISL